jgi:hypothetical protein
MFIPRHPVTEDQFCSYGEQTGTAAEGIGGVVAYAGSVVYLDPAATNQEAMVSKMAHDTAGTSKPFGFLMQKVKTGYHQVHPSGYYMPGDLGSSDVIAQPKYHATNGTIVGTKAVPVGVAHLGIWDTVHYTCIKTMDGTSSVVTADNEMKPGISLVAAADEAKLTNSGVHGDGGADDAGLGKCAEASTTSVARVLKGASAAKCIANIDNTTLYPIRIKLLI